MVVAAYFALPYRFRWMLLLLASYYFYMSWNYKYVILILAATAINYMAGIFIGSTQNKLKRKAFLTIGVVTSLGILFFYKYFNFFGDSLNALFQQFSIAQTIPYYDVLLPVGISFYTFQTLSYTIDVYYRKQPVERHFGIFALYVSFFPQLVAGPIERSVNLLPQFYKKNDIDYARIRDGAILAIWGYFKKVVIADRLAEYVNTVYNQPTDHSGLQLALATFFFAFQIYCDFSGYSDIAIGTAKIMGYDLMTNFRRPYFSTNIREFWQRWHISLSSWFRDYVYIPLGGNRVAKWRWYLNLFITFLVSGLWHGANWTFVIWGALHGIYQVVGTSFKNIMPRVSYPNLSFGVNVLITFLIVCFAWIFFRANNVSEAFYIVHKIFDFSTYSGLVNLFHFKVDLFFSLLFLSILLVIEVMMERGTLVNRLRAFSKPLKWTLLILILAVIMVFGKWDEVNFLYFQF
jgi:D-alanyl-lipoteichoic acid acyltransferase DltB (MBOAT superfamily)